MSSPRVVLTQNMTSRLTMTCCVPQIFAEANDIDFSKPERKPNKLLTMNMICSLEQLHGWVCCCGACCQSYLIRKRPAKWNNPLSAQIFGFPICSPIKGTRASWRNGSFKDEGWKYTRLSAWNNMSKDTKAQQEEFSIAKVGTI